MVSLRRRARLESDVARASGPRVLFVLTSADRRGAETQGRNVAAALRERGLRTDIVALSPAKYGDGLDVEVIGATPLALATLRRLRARARECDAVVAFGSTSLPACSAALIGCPARLVYRSIGDPRDWARGRLHRLRTRMLFLRVDHVAALWTGAAEAFGDLYGVPAQRRSVIPNNRSTEIYRPCTPDERAKARASLGYDRDDLVVAFVGSLSHEKRPSLAVAALEHLATARLLFVGDGPLRRDVEDSIPPALSSRVRFLGAISDVLEIYRAVDVVLLTSSTEGMPGVLLEAALCGLPAASSAVGSVPDLVASGCVIETFAPNAPPSKIAAALERAVERSSEAMEAVDPIASRYSAEAVALRWAELLNTNEAGSLESNG